MTDMTQDPSAGHSARPAGVPPPILGTSGEQAATEANRATVRAAFQAWQDGTGTITSLFAPDMVWRIEGHSAVSKEYGNRQEFINEVLAPFGARFAAGQQFRPVRIRSIHADGDTVIVVWTAAGWQMTAFPTTTPMPG